jgi:hypothetical protein
VAISAWDCVAKCARRCAACATKISSPRSSSAAKVRYRRAVLICFSSAHDAQKHLLLLFVDEPDARFVYLTDCKHTVEVTGLDTALGIHVPSAGVGSASSDVSIKFPECPKCKTPIRTSLRYGSRVIEVTRDIDQIKQVRHTLIKIVRPATDHRPWQSTTIP